ncbi:MAG TPA: pseudouridine synthase [Anaerolineales bacterium]
MNERLQKILSQAGYGSRRACEAFIAAGRVRVDGHVAVLGEKADPANSTITLDGQRIRQAEVLTYVALYKPRNVISSADDPAGRTTVRELVPDATHLYPVGRLDWDSEGLVLMTNDGELTNRLTHPRYGHTKEYRVLIARRPGKEQLETWRRGVVLEDGYRTAPATVALEAAAGKGTWLRVEMGEGRKRQIREIGSLLGLPVVRIIRVRIGTLTLGRLMPGEWRHLNALEIKRLREPVAKAAPSAGAVTRPVKKHRPGPRKFPSTR